jgi:MerR family transcriptional regulator, light-induced transcriptional regulator
MSRTNLNEAGFSIAAVERDTGLSKDVLRVWERRYGFPAPERDAHGERRYPAAQVRRLRLIKRLMDQGHRPGRLLQLPAEALDSLVPSVATAVAPLGNVRATEPPASPASRIAVEAALAPAETALDALVDLVRRHDSQSFGQALRQRLAREGLNRFVQDTVAPLAVSIGLAWEHGALQVFEEHLFTELTGRVLRQALAAVPGGAAPRVLLTTLPGEPHALGLLMVEAMLSLEGSQCVSLGTQMPLADIARAAAAHRADIVALSFSASFPARQAAGLLAELRAALPNELALWAGGSGLLRATVPSGVERLDSFESLVEAVAQWRASRDK